MKKKKVGFWQRVRNIYNDSPWHAAFTYPIAYIIIALVLFGIFLSIDIMALGIFFLCISFINTNLGFYWFNNFKKKTALSFVINYRFRNPCYFDYIN